MAEISNNLWESLSNLFISHEIEEMLSNLEMNNLETDIIQRYINGEYIIDEASGIINSSTFDFKSIEKTCDKINIIIDNNNKSNNISSFKIPIESLINMKKLICYCLYQCVNCNSNNLEIPTEGIIIMIILLDSV